MTGQQHLHALDRRIGELDDVGALSLQGQAAFLKTRGFDHLLDHPVDLIGLRDEQREHSVRFGGHVAQRARVEHREVTLDHGHRATQLVRRDVQEVSLRPLERGDLGAEGHPVEAGGDAGRVLM